MDKAKEQMEFLFEEGGMADDGLDRDPVSGNEVPSGSMSEEVRDDIPAQLSEGEYVVPADVVRYYGVKYFEDLRHEAKEGLGEMEEEGRIGGEPVDMEGDDTDLTPEEMAELESIMGMAVGGFVTEQPTQATDPYKAQTELYRSPAPVAIGNTGMQQQTRGYQVGGDVPAATQVMPDFSQYAAGYSFMGEQPGQTVPGIEPSQNVTLYGPNGEVVNLILPAQQAMYDDLMAQGYSTQPVAQVQTPQVQTPSDDNEQQAPPEREGMDRFGSLGKVDFSDPLGDAEAALKGEGRTGTIGGALVGMMFGLPGIGAVAGKAIGQANSIGEATANAEVANILGYDTTEINESIDSTIEDMNFASRFAARRARDRARELTKSRFYDALKDPSSNIQFSLDRSSFQTDEAYNQSLDDLARSVEQSSGLESGSVVAMGQGTDDEGSQFAQDYQRAARHAAQNPQGMTTGQGLSSSTDIESLLPPTPGQAPRSASDQAGDGGDSAKIICTAMNASYGFGSYRQAIWLQYSEKHLTDYHEKGYHKLFLPLVRKAYYSGEKNSKIIRAILEHGTRHRTADLRAEMQGKKRDTLGRIYRSIFEPICYIVGRLSK
jgi:hypothetical protein